MADKKIKVSVIHSSFVIGGAENMVYELTKSFDCERVNAQVITLHSPVGSSLEEKVENAGIQNSFACCEGRVTPAKLLKVFQMLREQQPDIIHAHMSGVIYGLPWILTHKTKMVVTAHTTPEKAFNKRTRSLLILLAKCNKVKLVAVSEENRRLMENAYGLNDKVAWINNGVDLNRYYRKRHNGIVLINVGRHDENKNQKLIIELFAEMHKSRPETRLVLCGDGPEHSNLVNLTKSLGLADCVDFTGNVSNIQDYLSEADIYIQSSHREGLPLSVIEAMAAQLPIISTDVGGMKDIVVNRSNGFLVTDGDKTAMFNAIVELSDKPEMRYEMGLQSREMANGYSSNEMAKQYEKLFIEAIGTV